MVAFWGDIGAPTHNAEHGFLAYSVFEEWIPRSDVGIAAMTGALEKDCCNHGSSPVSGGEHILAAEAAGRGIDDDP